LGNAGNTANTGDTAADTLETKPTEVESQTFLKRNYDWETPKILIKLPNSNSKEMKDMVLIYVTATNDYQKFNEAIRGAAPVPKYNSYKSKDLSSTVLTISKLPTTARPVVLQSGPTQMASSEFTTCLTIQNTKQEHRKKKPRYRRRMKQKDKQKEQLKEKENLRRRKRPKLQRRA